MTGRGPYLGRFLDWLARLKEQRRQNTATQTVTTRVGPGIELHLTRRVKTGFVSAELVRPLEGDQRFLRFVPLKAPFPFEGSDAAEFRKLASSKLYRFRWEDGRWESTIFSDQLTYTKDESYFRIGRLDLERAIDEAQRMAADPDTWDQ